MILLFTMFNNSELCFTTITENNEVGKVQVGRAELIHNIPNLEERDFYLLDRNYNFKTSTINKKGNLMLIKIDYFRCFIYEKTAYIATSSVIGANPDEAIVNMELLNFSTRLGSRLETLENNQKFKWNVLEEIFVDVSTGFQQEIETIAPKISLISNDLFTTEEHVITNKEFINLKIELLKMRARAKDVYDLFEELTPDDKEEEFDDDNLDERQNVFDDLIELYKIRFEESYNDIKNMLEILDTATEINSAQLDEKRNRMQRISIILELITLGLTVGALITGAFGMNLKNGLEGSNAAFVTVCLIIVVIISISCVMVKFVNRLMI